MSPLEYRVVSFLLRLVGWASSRLPIVPDRVVLASPRLSHLEGNLRFIDEAIRRRHPDLRPVVLVERYGHGLLAKAAYFLRMVRGMYYLRTAAVFVVDNAYLPVHVAPHRPGTRVVQVWHAASAIKRFGVDTIPPPTEPDRTFLHRYYDEVVVSSEAVRGVYAAGLRTPVERVLALGVPRTDFFFDEPAMDAARRRLLERHPTLAGRRVVLHAPTLRGRGSTKVSSNAIDPIRLRSLLPPEVALVLKPHPNVALASLANEGYDVLVDPAEEMNDLLALADVLVTDYSSAVFEFALLRRPIVLLVGDLDAYASNPGVCVDVDSLAVATAMDTVGLARAIVAGTFDATGNEAMLEHHMGACDGHSSDRFVERFVSPLLGGGAPG